MKRLQLQHLLALGFTGGALWWYLKRQQYKSPWFAGLNGWLALPSTLAGLEAVKLTKAQRQELRGKIAACRKQRGRWNRKTGVCVLPSITVRRPKRQQLGKQTRKRRVVRLSGGSAKKFATILKRRFPPTDLQLFFSGAATDAFVHPSIPAQIDAYAKLYFSSSIQAVAVGERPDAPLQTVIIISPQYLLLLEPDAKAENTKSNRPQIEQEMFAEAVASLGSEEIARDAALKLEPITARPAAPETDIITKIVVEDPSIALPIPTVTQTEQIIAPTLEPWANKTLNVVLKTPGETPPIGSAPKPIVVPTEMGPIVISKDLLTCYEYFGTVELLLNYGLTLYQTVPRAAVWPDAKGTPATLGQLGLETVDGQDRALDGTDIFRKDAEGNIVFVRKQVVPIYPKQIAVPEINNKVANAVDRVEFPDALNETLGIINEVFGTNEIGVSAGWKKMGVGFPRSGSIGDYLYKFDTLQAHVANERGLPKGSQPLIEEITQLADKLSLTASPEDKRAAYVAQALITGACNPITYGELDKGSMFIVWRYTLPAIKTLTRRLHDILPELLKRDPTLAAKLEVAERHITDNFNTSIKSRGLKTVGQVALRALKKIKHEERNWYPPRPLDGVSGIKGPVGPTGQTGPPGSCMICKQAKQPRLKPARPARQPKPARQPRPVRQPKPARQPRPVRQPRPAPPEGLAPPGPVGQQGQTQPDMTQFLATQAAAQAAVEAARRTGEALRQSSEMQQLIQANHIGSGDLSSEAWGRYETAMLWAMSLSNPDWQGRQDIPSGDWTYLLTPRPWSLSPWSGAQTPYPSMPGYYPSDGGSATSSTGGAPDTSTYSPPFIPPHAEPPGPYYGPPSSGPGGSQPYEPYWSTPGGFADFALPTEGLGMLGARKTREQRQAERLARRAERQKWRGRAAAPLAVPELTKTQQTVFNWRVGITPRERPLPPNVTPVPPQSMSRFVNVPDVLVIRLPWMPNGEVMYFPSILTADGRLKPGVSGTNYSDAKYWHDRNYRPLDSTEMMTFQSVVAMSGFSRSRSPFAIPSALL